ncbi:MAG: transcription termination factor Rho [Defluviitaleaceae bacterium]|nr:transcription termination factor Rho [Defluviitaleaceae bacterium]
MELTGMSLVQLKDFAKELGIKNVSRTKKAELTALIEEHLQKNAPVKKVQKKQVSQEQSTSAPEQTLPKKRGRPPKKPKDNSENIIPKPEEPTNDMPTQEDNIITQSSPPLDEEPDIVQESDYSAKDPDIKTESMYDVEDSDATFPQVQTDSDVTTEVQVADSQPQATGILEILPDGFGFLRVNNFLPSSDDVYLSPTQIRRFNLRTGDLVCGSTRHGSADKFSAISYIHHVNGEPPYMATRRPYFDYLTPIYPMKRITLETNGVQATRHQLAPRIIDLLSPIGFGQRGMIVSPPKAGKTVLLKQIANAITKNHPDVHLIVLLIDERPEEVTDMERSITGEHCTVVSSTFDEQPENHKRLAEIVLERAKRLVEQKKDLVILMDSITRLGRAYNLTIPMGGRTLSGGLDPAALYMPKKFFGAARKVEEGGSLTVLATALVETGSKMDDVIFEEFKGTGNMELVLDRRMAERRVFPAIDIMRSGTRRDDLLLNGRELDAMYTLREMSGRISSAEFSEQVADMLLKSKDNKDFVDGFMEVKRY